MPERDEVRSMESRCEGLTESLTAYLYDDLPEIEREEVKEHLRTCSKCRERLGEFEAVRGMLDEIDVPPMPARGDLAARVMARAHARPRWIPVSLPAARAALLLIGIGLGVGITWLALPHKPPVELTTKQVEALVEAPWDQWEAPKVVVAWARKKFRVPSRYHDDVLPILNRHKQMQLDKDYRVLRDRVRGESKRLAAYIQLDWGDYYAEKVKDPDRARQEYLKVREIVTEGKVYDLAMSRIENLLLAEPEGR